MKQKESMIEFEEESIENKEDSARDEEFQPNLRISDHNQNRINLDYFIAEVVRYGWSDRAAAAAFNASLKAVGVITDGNDKLAVDKNKIRRARDSFGAKQKQKQKSQVDKTGGLQCIGADGKRNKKTKQRVIQIFNGVETVKIVTKSQEHIVYTQPPGSYLTHSEIAPNKGTCIGLAEDFLDVIIENNSELSIEAVVCDGTNTNVGWKDGMLAHLERKLTPPRLLLWLVCLAHGNELPYRAFFSYCDGGIGTSGPDSFKGPLGKASCREVHLMPIVKFDPITSSLHILEDKVWKDLSRDQQLLYRYVHAIVAGKVPDDLARQVAGPVNHARWLTHAIREMQVYTRTERPSPELVKLITYIVQVYAPVWFSIKSNSKFTSGPSIMFKLMTLIKTQPQDTQRVVKPVVQRNGYFAHPSTMLCSMLESDDMCVRNKAVKLIKQARENPPKKERKKCLQGLRKFFIPPLQWQAKKWWDIIDWKSKDVKVH